MANPAPASFINEADFQALAGTVQEALDGLGARLDDKAVALATRANVLRPLQVRVSPLSAPCWPRPPMLARAAVVGWGAHRGPAAGALTLALCLGGAPCAL